MSTYFPKAGEIVRKWYVVDASQQSLGRVASRVASILMGKENPKYTPFLDTGDHVIVINAEKVAFTGNKRQDKTYYWHSGYPGGIKERKAHQVLDGRFPERVLEAAVRRMLPRGPLGKRQMTNLRIYKGPSHPHEAQQPEALDIRALNVKNSFRG